MSRTRTKDGIPVDGNEWTEQDWSDLWQAMKRVRRRIASRHRAVSGPSIGPGGSVTLTSMSTRPDGPTR